jgi:hypothetical protein
MAWAVGDNWCVYGIGDVYQREERSRLEVGVVIKDWIECGARRQAGHGHLSFSALAKATSGVEAVPSLGRRRRSRAEHD